MSGQVLAELGYRVGELPERSVLESAFVSKGSLIDIAAAVVEHSREEAGLECPPDLVSTGGWERDRCKPLESSMG